MIITPSNQSVITMIAIARQRQISALYDQSPNKRIQGRSPLHGDRPDPICWATE
jgi:hypothetical protein